jgi:hypothetical protein
LEIRRLFVLADVQASGCCHARDFAVNAINIRDVARADGLDDKIEFGVSEFREVIDRCFERAKFKTALSRQLTVTRQHLRADIDHRDERAYGSEQGAVPPASGSEAEDPFAGNVAAKPPAIIDERPWIGKLRVTGRLGVCQAPARAVVPRRAVVFVWRFH